LGVVPELRSVKVYKKCFGKPGCIVDPTLKEEKFASCSLWTFICLWCSWDGRLCGAQS